MVAESINSRKRNANFAHSLPMAARLWKQRRNASMTVR